MALTDEEFDSLGFTFVWRIENFSYCLEKRNCFIQSPNFVTNFKNGEQNFDMRIYPRGEGHSNAIIYYLDGFNCGLGFMDFQLSILASDGSLKTVIEKEMICMSARSKATFIRHEELFGEKKKIYLPRDTLTLHLRMWESNQVRSWLGQSFARTQIGVQKRSIICKIQKVSDMQPHENKIFLGKPSFKENISLRFCWRNSFECKEILQLEISETDVSQDSLICVKVSILDYKGNCAYLTEGDHWLEKREGENTWSFPFSILKSTLMENKDLYLPNDTLILQCDLALSSGVIYSELEIAEVGTKDVPCVNSFIPEVHQLRRKSQIDSDFSNTLSADLLNLYTEGSVCDFELKSDSSRFPVHKAILVARSPVFRKMLSSDMIEKNTNMVDIPDLDSDTVKRMLHFMYTDAIEVADWGAISKLYFAADKYEIESLKKKCSSFLERNICAANLTHSSSTVSLHAVDPLHP
ncbi:hypothetical protein JTE90_011705 [Oedothorax gibbosus]|uniref:Uncharacterized protein n=1 Tax=Oedothorax gibbosus TaxID=931172 RepID=A0AAV6UUM4_9ARAC|nr:hypothetical protein JTE90_011705 [Oedothorax gibbosus]